MVMYREGNCMFSFSSKEEREAERDVGEAG